MVAKEGAIHKYIGVASETKPSGVTVPKGSTFYEWDEDQMMITPDSGSTWVAKGVGPLEFFFRPGNHAASSGMVESGTRSYNEETVSTVDKNTTYWSSSITYNPYKSGKVDGLSAGGIFWGELTIGYIAATQTPDAKFTARIQNLDGASWTTCLALTATVATTSTVAYKTYDIPYLRTDGHFNAIPFSVQVGVQSDASTKSVQARIMESSYIQGEYIPGT